MNSDFEIHESILATNNQRLTNYVVDSIIKFVLQLLFITVLTFVLTMMGYKNVISFITNMSYLHELMVSCLITLLYYNFMEMLFGISIGKLITGTVVVNINGEKPSLGDISIRSICRLIPFNALSFLGIPCRGWHDKLSATYVVNSKLLEMQKNAYQLKQNQDQNNQ